MKRNQSYERVFATWVRRQGAAALPLSELLRQPLLDSRKTPDFLVLGECGAHGCVRLVVDVKGRRAGRTATRHRGWPNWCTQADLEALPAWAAALGVSFVPILAFVYALEESTILPAGTPDQFLYRGQRYLIRGVDARAYRQRMRCRSRRWQTVHLRVADFRELVQPFSWFLQPHPTHGSEDNWQMRDRLACGQRSQRLCIQEAAQQTPWASEGAEQ